MSGGERAARIVALGDSTTAGTRGFLSPMEAPPDGRGDVEGQYVYWLARAVDTRGAALLASPRSSATQETTRCTA